MSLANFMMMPAPESNRMNFQWMCTLPLRRANRGAQGKRKGLKDPRGQLLKVPLVYISRHRPRLCLVENVKGLCAKKNRGVLKGIKQTLQKLNYRVLMGIMNASDFRVPQNRKRLFIIAIRQDSYRRTFRWPKKRQTKLEQHPGPTENHRSAGWRTAKKKPRPGKGGM